MNSENLFDKLNPKGPPCFYCNTMGEGPAILVPIPETEEDGVQEARQAHVRCYTYSKGYRAGLVDAAGGINRAIDNLDLSNGIGAK